MSTANLNNAASVRARLLNLAKAQGVDFNQVLVRFALAQPLRTLRRGQWRPPYFNTSGTGGSSFHRGQIGHRP